MDFFIAKIIHGHRWICFQNVKNRFWEANIRPQRPAIRPLRLLSHSVGRLVWQKRHRGFKRLSGSSTIGWVSGSRVRAFRCVGKHFDACVIQRCQICGRSSIVKGGITTHRRTPYVIVGNSLIGVRYRAEITRQQVNPFVHHNQYKQFEKFRKKKKAIF